MKFSVLLPTRNRLELLQYAVETVRRQDYDNWEIIVSDNHSDQDIAGYIRSLNDDRVRYFRTDTFIPVTDNWNNALERSTGDYVIMLGDDDCLLPRYFLTIRDLVQRFERPDLIYTSALLYAYPGVMPGFPDGFLQPYGYASFLHPSKDAYWLERAAAHDAVRQSMSFRVVYGFNMQFAIVSRSMIERLKPYGSFYQSPYPDYYAMNALFLKGERILVYPHPLVTIGISPKSFGYFYFNDTEESGVQFLKNIPDQHMANRLAAVILPGTNMNTSWLLAMETLKANFGADGSLRVYYARYRLLQLVQMLGNTCVKSRTSRRSLLRLLGYLKGWEIPVYGICIVVISIIMAFLPVERRQRYFDRLISLLRTYPRYDPGKIEGKFRNIVDVFEHKDRFPADVT